MQGAPNSILLETKTLNVRARLSPDRFGGAIIAAIHCTHRQLHRDFANASVLRERFGLDLFGYYSQHRVNASVRLSRKTTEAPSAKLEVKGIVIFCLWIFKRVSAFARY